MEKHYYPSDLATELLARWPAPAAAALPAPAVLTQLVSVAYQASLLREEGRPVRCRLVLTPPAGLAASAATVGSPYVLELETARAYEEQEIRRLSPAAQAQRSVLAVRLGPDQRLLIWGMMLTAHDWDQLAEIPHPSKAPPPLAPLIHVRGPGNIVFYYGNTRVLTLQQGRIDGHGFLQFPAAWARGRFTEALGGFVQHSAEVALPVDAHTLRELVVLLAQHSIRRVVTRVRASGHGGMLAFIPADGVAQCVGPSCLLRPKYRVQVAGKGHQYSELLFAIIRRLAELGEVSWPRYQQSRDLLLAELDVEVGLFAELLADLMAVDGALILTKQLEIVGFGVEIHAPLLAIDSVHRALDVEATVLQEEAADCGGTRHRAAYRLCMTAPESMAIVISQDGGVKFVHQQANKIIFWEQLAL